MSHWWSTNKPVKQSTSFRFADPRRQPSRRLAPPVLATTMPLRETPVTEPRATSAAQPSRSDIGQRVKELRLRRGMTLRSLAARLSISPATLSAIENGHTGLSSVRLAQVAGLLEVPVEVLFTATDPASGQPWYSAAPMLGLGITPERRRTERKEVAPSEAVTAFDWRAFPPLVLDPPLAAALSTFLSLGYHGATMRRIAQRAGLSVPGVYHYYPSKHDMLVAILDLTMDDLLRRSSAAREEGHGPVERFTLLVECLALYHTHRRELGFVGASEMRSLATPARDRLAATRRAQQRMVDEEVLAAAASGEFGTQRPLEAARAVVTMCTALPQWYSAAGPNSAEAIAGQYVQFALDLVRYTPIRPDSTGAPAQRTEAKRRT